MSRQYSAPLESVEYHRRSNQPYEATANYVARESPRAFPMNRTSPLQDHDSDKGDQQPRRRIGLACSRCRKRKIKCSGDIGGAGCQNCKNAGAEECNFLRVNSTSVFPATTTIEYPYSNPASSSLPAHFNRGHNGAGLHYAGGFGMTQPTGAGSYPTRNGSTNGQYYPPGSRHSHPSALPTCNLGNLNDDMFDHYPPAPHYLLPAQDPQSVPTYSGQDSSRHWTPITSNRHTNFYYESDPSLRYGASGFPYLNSSAIVGSEGFGMNSLSRHLPQHGDRVLPNPRKSYEASSNSYQKSGESASHGLPMGLSHKSSVAWSPQTLTASHGSMSSSSLSAFSGPLSSVSSSPPTESNQGASTFGYVPLSSTSPLHQPLPLSRGSESEYASYAAGNRSSLPERPFPKGRTILPHGSGTSLYGYSTSTGAKASTTTDSMHSEHKLVSGRPYIRIHENVKLSLGEPLPVDQPPAATANQTAVTTHARDE